MPSFPAWSACGGYILLAGEEVFSIIGINHG